MLDGVDAEPIEIGKGDPELIDLAEGIERRRGLILIDFLLSRSIARGGSEMDILQIPKVSFDKFWVIVPVTDPALLGKRPRSYSAGHRAPLGQAAGCRVRSTGPKGSEGAPV